MMVLSNQGNGGASAATLIITLLIAGGLSTGAVATPINCGGRAVTQMGTAGDDHIRGTSKRDVIAGLGGNDVISGGDGTDFICGGSGRDRISGQGGKDDLSGDRGRDVIRGGSGADTATGAEGADRLVLGAGDDWFEAGDDPGRDVFTGRSGADTLDMSVTEPTEGEPDDATGPATVDLAEGEATSSDGGEDRLEEIENVYGTGAGDLIYGDETANVLSAGYNGGGTLDGRGGDDILSTGQDGGTMFLGGPGNDVINPLESNQIDGGDGTDHLDFCGPTAGTSANITVDLAAGTSQERIRNESHGVNRLVSIEDVTTCSGDDTLFGDGQDNRLDSGEGTDSIDGREGRDTCIRGETTLNCEA